MSRSIETTTQCTDFKPSWLIKAQETSRLITKGNYRCFSSGKHLPLKMQLDFVMK